MSESVQIAELEQRLKESELEIEVCRTQYNESLRKYVAYAVYRRVES